MNIAQTIIANAKANHSVLCWDGVNSKEDLIENIRCYVSHHTGWRYLAIEFKDDVLRIWGRTEEDKRQVPISYDGYWITEEKDYTRQEHLLSYNVRTGTEIYGRLRNVGLYYPHIKELEELLTAV